MSFADLPFNTGCFAGSRAGRNWIGWSDGIRNGELEEENPCRSAAAGLAWVSDSAVWLLVKQPREKMRWVLFCLMYTESKRP